MLPDSQGNLPADIVAELCDGIRIVLEHRDLKRYINSILTAHVVKRPPDHEAALSLLLRLKGVYITPSAWIYPTIFAESEPQLVEDAVKYVIFLVDADKLFDTALGMYDFSIVLMIAQHSQRVCHYASFPDWRLTVVSGSKRISPVPP